MEDASLNVMCTVNIELTAAAIAYGIDKKARRQRVLLMSLFLPLRRVSLR
jgi:molecular chaperone DnaK (HSP70)